MLSLPAIFATSLLIGYSGAMTPGPLLTYAVGESARRGAVAGPLIATGHAVLELLLVLALILGLSAAFDQHLVVSTIAGAGGVVIGIMGVLMLRSSPRASLDRTFSAGGVTAGPAQALRSHQLRPVLGGALVSIANPYWILWWVGISAAYFQQISAYGAAGYSAFFVGHILADFTWYGLVGYVVASGSRFVSDRIYGWLIGGSGAFLILLGAIFVYSAITGAL